MVMAPLRDIVVGFAFYIGLRGPRPLWAVAVEDRY